MEDLQGVIFVGQAAVDVTSEDHQDRALRPSNLEGGIGRGLGDRYLRTGSLDDLQEVTRVEQAAVEAIPEDHPDRAVF